jgi:hypothetical protein
MKADKWAVAFALIALAGMTTVWAQNDAEGSRDHPLITRMPGYYIDSYRTEEFAAFDPTVIDGNSVHWEGKEYSLTTAQA